MSGHDVEIEHKSGTTYHAQCRCKKWADGTKGDMETWEIEHKAEAARAQAALMRSTPALKTSLKHYEDMAENDPDVGARPLWKILADELRPRVKTGKVESDDVPLFDLPTE